MLHWSQRDSLIDAVQYLRSEGILDLTGGAISLRVGEHILMTPAGASFRRWHLVPEELVVVDRDGTIIEGGPYKAAASLPLAMALFEELTQANAIIHTHSSASLAYACAGSPMPCVTNSAAQFGEIPLLGSDAWDVVERARQDPSGIRIPPAMIQRADVAAVNWSIAHQALARLGGRASELERHSLVFLLANHGVVVVSQSLEQGLDNLVKVEANARVSLALSAAALPARCVGQRLATNTVASNVLA
jgi:ribulose-5-phosphate 4-epimerase/fuculose-1-phosphate aldolase